MSLIAHEREELVKGCLQGRDRSHCPYSRFPVGAAVLATKENGKMREIFVGESGIRPLQLVSLLCIHCRRLRGQCCVSYV